MSTPMSGRAVIEDLQRRRCTRHQGSRAVAMVKAVNCLRCVEEAIDEAVKAALSNVQDSGS